jgi:outer membrane protein, heavy metal efflux system
MIHRTVAALAAMLALTLVKPAAAEASGADEPALAALVSEALANNPDLKALEHSVVAARSRPAQARSLPDPMLSVGYTNDGWSPSLGSMPDSVLSVMVGQNLPWPGKRALRGAIAEQSAAQVAQQLERAKLSVAASVRRAYHGLRQARMLLDLVSDQERVWTQIEGVARARYTVGQGIQQDVLRTQIEVTRVGQLEAEQRAEEAVRLAELNRLLGRPAEAAIELEGPAARVLQAVAVEPLPAVMDRLRAASPELAAARASVEAARLGVELAKKDFKPDLTVQAGYMNRGGLDPMWQAGIGVNLPLARGRRKAALAQAEAELRAAEQRVNAFDLQLRFRTQERLALLVSIERMAQLYEEGVLPQSRLSVEAAVASYQTGRVPFISVLEALGTLYADRGAIIRLIASRGQVLASIEEASLQATAGAPAMPGMAGGAPAMGTRPMDEDMTRGRSTAAMGSSPSMND